MTTTQTHGELRDLIAERKGDRSYAQLSSACDGQISRQQLQWFATQRIKEFPGPANLEALARALNVPVMHVIRAVAVSLGINTGTRDASDLVLLDAKRLPATSQELLISMATEMIALQEHGGGSEDATVHQFVPRAAHKGEPEVDPYED